MRLDSIDHVAITVSDVQRSVQWYTETLGLRHESPWDGEPQLVCAGESCVALFSATGSGKRPSDDEKRSGLTMRHFAFRTDRMNFQQAQAEFHDRGIEFEFEDHEVCHSIYIEDPDGHRVEITTYEI